MRNILLYIVFVIASNSLTSQVCIGMRSGILNSRLINSDPSGLGNLRESIEVVNSPYFGASLGSSRESRIRIAASINYYRKGGKPSRAEAQTGEGEKDTWYVYETFRIHYLDMGSEIELKLSKVFFLSLGPYTAYMLAFNKRFYSDGSAYAPSNSQITTPTIYDELRKWDFGLATHVGIEMKNSIRIELGFMRGSQCVFHDPSVSANSIKNQSFSFGLGYVFPFHKQSKSGLQ